MRRKLGKFICWSEKQLEAAERGDEHAQMWCAFFNWSALCLVVILAVLFIKWWMS